MAQYVKLCLIFIWGILIFGCIKLSMFLINAQDWVAFFVGVLLMLFVALTVFNLTKKLLS